MPLSLHKRYIKSTDKEAIVSEMRVHLCNLTTATVQGARLQARKIYINTRVLKHVYDKRPAQEYDFLLRNIHQVIKYPEQVYQNGHAKRGDYAFVKKIKQQICFVSVEVVDSETDNERCCGEVVTFYVLRKPNYLNKYKLLWSWEGDNPPS